MTRKDKTRSVEVAAGRLFRGYDRHCQAPSIDSLFETLTALHSLSDRLKANGCPDLHQFEEFIALKVLRNFAHHEEEVAANVRIIPTPTVSDLSYMCIVRRDQVERAIKNVNAKWREASQIACEGCFHWYGEAVNINPCLFNLMVRIYELLVELGLSPSEEDNSQFQTSYEREEEEGLPHFIDGRLSAHAGDLNIILSKVIADLPQTER